MGCGSSREVAPSDSQPNGGRSVHGGKTDELPDLLRGSSRGVISVSGSSGGKGRGNVGSGGGGGDGEEKGSDGEGGSQELREWEEEEWKEAFQSERPVEVRAADKKTLTATQKELLQQKTRGRAGSLVRAKSRRSPQLSGTKMRSVEGVAEESSRSGDASVHDEDVRTLMARGVALDEAVSALLLTRLREEDLTAVDVKELFDGTRAAQRSIALYVVLGEYLLGKGEPLLAEEILYRGQEQYREVVEDDEVTEAEKERYRRLRQLHGLALAQAGTPGRAIKELEHLRSQGYDDDETMGLLARCYKDLGNRAHDTTRRRRAFERARGIYNTSFTRHASYYTGVNAATLSLLLGELEEAREKAATVVELCREELQASGVWPGADSVPESPDDPRAGGKIWVNHVGGSYWPLATLGEAYVILGKWSIAAKYYSRARIAAGKDYVRLASTQRQLRMLLKHAQNDDANGEKSSTSSVASSLSTKEIFREIFDMPSVVICASAQHDVSVIPAPRAEEVFGRALDRLLQSLRAAFVFSSPDSVADIIFLEAALRRGCEVFVIIPVPLRTHLADCEKRFKALEAAMVNGVETSVGTVMGSEEGEESSKWLVRLRRVLEAASRVDVANDLSHDASTVNRQYGSLILTGLAAKRARALGAPLRRIYVKPRLVSAELRTLPRVSSRSTGIMVHPDPTHPEEVDHVVSGKEGEEADADAVFLGTSSLTLLMAGEDSDESDVETIVEREDDFASPSQQLARDRRRWSRAAHDPSYHLDEDSDDDRNDPLSPRNVAAGGLISMRSRVRTLVRAHTFLTNSFKKSKAKGSFDKESKESRASDGNGEGRKKGVRFEDDVEVEKKSPAGRLTRTLSTGVLERGSAVTRRIWRRHARAFRQHQKAKMKMFGKEAPPSPAAGHRPAKATGIIEPDDTTTKKEAECRAAVTRMESFRLVAHGIVSPHPSIMPKKKKMDDETPTARVRRSSLDSVTNDEGVVQMARSRWTFEESGGGGGSGMRKESMGLTGFIEASLPGGSGNSFGSVEDGVLGEARRAPAPAPLLKPPKRVTGREELQETSEAVLGSARALLRGAVGAGKGIASGGLAHSFRSLNIDAEIVESRSEDEDEDGEDGDGGEVFGEVKHDDDDDVDDDEETKDLEPSVHRKESDRTAASTLTTRSSSMRHVGSGKAGASGKSLSPPPGTTGGTKTVRGSAGTGGEGEERPRTPPPTDPVTMMFSQRGDSARSKTVSQLGRSGKKTSSGISLGRTRTAANTSTLVSPSGLSPPRDPNAAKTPPPVRRQGSVGSKTKTPHALFVTRGGGTRRVAVEKDSSNSSSPTPGESGSGSLTSMGKELSTSDSSHSMSSSLSSFRDATRAVEAELINTPAAVERWVAAGDTFRVLEVQSLLAYDSVAATRFGHIVSVAPPPPRRVTTLTPPLIASPAPPTKGAGEEDSDNGDGGEADEKASPAPPSVPRSESDSSVGFAELVTRAKAHVTFGLPSGVGMRMDAPIPPMVRQLVPAFIHATRMAKKMGRPSMTVAEAIRASAQSAAEAAAEAERRGIGSASGVGPRMLRRGGSGVNAAVAALAKPEETATQPSVSGRQVVMSQLFADVVGFSKLGDHQIQSFIENFLGACANLIESLPRRSQPKVRNTWGDALYLVFSRVSDAGEFALKLRDLVIETPWEALGLPRLSIRISVHAAPVFCVVDPVLKEVNYSGANTSRAARIEPATAPGAVYVSQAFAAIAEALRTEESTFETEFVGNIPLAKGYGSFPVYSLAWADKVAPRTPKTVFASMREKLHGLADIARIRHKHRTTEAEKREFELARRSRSEKLRGEKDSE